MRSITRVPSVLTLAIVAGTFFADVAHAEHPWQCSAFGCNLRWDRCYADGGTANRNFACDTNVGVETLVASFVPGVDVGSVGEIDLIVDIASASPTLPAWWQFKNTGSCRVTSLTLFPVVPPVACPPWNVEAVPSVGQYVTNVSGSPNRARIVAAAAVPAESRQNLLAGQEYFALNIHINHAKTVGTGACTGCQTPVCMVLQSVLMRSPVPNETCWVSGPANHVDSHFATWQGGGVPVVGEKIGCPAATPARSSSWGSVKSLYR